MFIFRFFLIVLGIAFLFPAQAAMRSDRISIMSALWEMSDMAEDRVRVYQSPRFIGEYLKTYRPDRDRSYKEVLELVKEESGRLKEFCTHYLEKINDERIPLNTILGELLLHRLEFLFNRTQSLEEYFGKKDRSSFVVPTLPQLYDNEDFVLDLPDNRIQKQFSIDLYQVIQRTIFLIWNGMEPEEVQGKTMHWLSMSPHLWDFLEQRTQDPGLPDECGGYAPVWFLYQKHKGSIRQKGNIAYVIATYTWPDYRSSRLTTASYKFGDIEESFKRFRQKCDGEIYKAYSNLGETGIEAEKFADLWPGERAVPLFVQKILEKRSKEESFSPVMEDPFLGQQKKKDKTEGASVAGRKEELSMTGAGAATGSDDMVKEESNLGLTSVTREELLESEIPSLAGAKAPIKALKSPPALKHAYSFDYPRGIRGKPILAHAHTGVQQVSARVQSFINQLFDPSQIDQITFKDFESVWKSIGGSIEGYQSGGSHRLIVAPTGQSLWGTYDHGGYGPHTIKYLQSAFWFLGYRPGNFYGCG